MQSTNSPDPRVLLDAGILIGALTKDDPRHPEARAVVEQARSGQLRACTTTGILSEVYAALTWQGAKPPHPPEIAGRAVLLLVEAPSALEVLEENRETSLLMLELAQRHRLTARRVHDARHAAAALSADVRHVYTYDVYDWSLFQEDGLTLAGPESVLAK
jgi:predicted nucleic acid-binding protein